MKNVNFTFTFTILAQRLISTKRKVAIINLFYRKNYFFIEQTLSIFTNYTCSFASVIRVRVNRFFYTCSSDAWNPIFYPECPKNLSSHGSST